MRVKLAMLFSLLFALYFFKLNTSFNYDSDFGRDISAILKITQGDITLLGPKTSFGGLYTGPYYYYLFAPIILFSKNPIFVVYFNTLLFVLSVAIIFLFCRRSTIYDLTPKSFIPGLMWLFTSPLMVYSARNPGNAFTYIPLLLLFLLAIPWIQKQTHPLFFIFYGFIGGLILNIHVVNVLIVIPLIFVLAAAKKSYLPLLMFIGIFISLTPSILFELTHNFIQLRNTFIDKSYQSFISNTNIPNSLPSSSNPIVNFWLQLVNSSNWIGVPFVILFFVNILLFIKNSKSHNLSTKSVFLLSLISFILVSILGRSQMTFFYLYPFILLTQVSLFFLISKTRFSSLLFGILIIFNLFFIPRSLFETPSRSIPEFDQFTRNLIKTELWTKVDTKSYNLYVARETPNAPQGWEYRYFLGVNKISPLPPDQFSQSQNLLVIQESNNKDNIETLKSWEFDQFGTRKMVEFSVIDGRKIYLYEKK